MTYTKYSHQHLRSKSLAQLKRIYSEIGCTAEVIDRRCKDEWRSAIAQYQSAQLQKIACPAKDEQTIAQGEFEQYIEDQATAIAPTSLTTVELSFYEQEIYAGSQLVATITYDHNNFVTQPWVVMVNGVEKFRHQIWNTCRSFITWHFKQRTLNKSLPIPPAPALAEVSQGPKQVTILEISDFEQQQYQQNTLPVQEKLDTEEFCTTDNEIIVQIFNEYEQHGLELVEHGIYQEDKKLGEVGFTDELWCFTRVNQKRTFCDSVEDAVWLLQIPEDAGVRGAGSKGEILSPPHPAPCSLSSFLPTANEYLQYHPLEQLSSGELQRLFETAALVAV